MIASILATLLLLNYTGTTLEVVAILVYGNKDVKPVAHTYFIVLDKDIETILHEAEVGCELPAVHNLTIATYSDSTTEVLTLYCMMRNVLYISVRYRSFPMKETIRHI